MTTLFYRRFHLIWLAVTEVRYVLNSVLNQLSIDKNDIENTSLVLTEYLTNLIRHSEGEDQAVTLVISKSRSMVEVKIIDPTPYYEVLNKPKHYDCIEDGLLREGGMGIALIQHYFPDYQYISLAQLNHFYVRLQLLGS